MIFIFLSIAILFISSASSCGETGEGFGTNSNSSFFGIISGPCVDKNAEPVRIYKNVTTKIISNYGDSVQFECYASGTPPPIIEWTKRDYYDGDVNILLPNGKTEYEGNILQFPSVTQKSQGTYICNAKNINWFYDYQFYTLEVKAKPLIKESIQEYHSGWNIQLKCTAHCNPVSTFKWYKNDQLLITENKDKVDKGYRDLPDILITSKLDISTKNNDYKGSYKCEIENEFGKDEHVFEVNGSVESAAS